MGAIGGMLGLNGGISGTGFNPQSGTNQSQINNSYNAAQTGMGGQADLLNALKAQNGLQNQSQVYDQTQGIVNGTGPNPAAAMLNQTTGANVANQASLMAGQRGSGANAGLIARQAAQTGAGIQQQAAGQGATMQANQSLNAIGQAGNMAGSMAANQIGQTNANVGSQLAEQSALLNANTASQNVQGQMANTTMGGQQKMIGGIMNGISGVPMMAAEGGQVPSAYTPQSMFGQFVNSQGASSVPTFATPDTKAFNMGGKKPANPMAGAEKIAVVAAEGGKVPAMVSPGERFLRPAEAKAVAQGKANPLSVGEQIPGQAKVSGDSYKNDTVPKKLDAGGVVIPRSVMQSKDPAKGAADFVRAVMAKKKAKIS